MHYVTESPFAHLIGTNDVPSDDEATRLSQLISGPVEELRRLNDEITHLSPRIDELRLKRDEVQAYVDAHKVLLSPVRRLAPDVLGEIFVRCLPPDRNPTRSVSEAPLLLGTICRSWRDISLSTPRLWTGIHIYIPRGLPVNYHESLIHLTGRRTQGVQRWLGRSGTLPLSISLTIDYDLDRNPISPLEELLRTLMRLAPRWACLDLRVPYPVLKILQQSLKPDDLPLLCDFRADLVKAWPPENDVDLPESLIQGFLAAPTLDSVAIIHYLQPTRSLLLPMTSLTSLAIQNLGDKGLLFTTQEALVILLQCKRLRRLNLATRIVHSTANDALRIDLPDLLDLTFVMYGGGDPSAQSYHAFFARLYTPSLMRMSVVFPSVPDNDPGVGADFPFLSLLSGHESQLESLHTTLPTSAEALVKCLRLVPRLTVLRMKLVGTPGQTVDVVSAHLQPLIPTDASPIPLCPSLEDVHISVVPEKSRPSDEALLAFAQSRWRPTYPGISRLKKFHADINRRMLTDIRPQVRALQEEGMDLVITHISEFDPADEGAYASTYFKLL